MTLLNPDTAVARTKSNSALTSVKAAHEKIIFEMLEELDSCQVQQLLRMAALWWPPEQKSAAQTASQSSKDPDFSRRPKVSTLKLLYSSIFSILVFDQ